MEKNLSVTSIMTKKVITVDKNCSLRKVNTLFKENNIRHIPVVDGKKLVGMISKTDILRLSFGDLYEDTEPMEETIFDLLQLENVMVRHPLTIEENETIEQVAKKFTEVEFHALPVVKGQEIVGIVSTTDLIRFLLQEC